MDVCVCVYAVCVLIHLCTNSYSALHIALEVCVCVCVCVFVCVFVCVCVCVCERERELEQFTSLNVKCLK